jgi:transcriptional regulator with XRE-family HTH domain
MKTVKNAKLTGNLKKLDWHLLVVELLDGLFLSQQELAERCKVSQQSISNWKNNTRNPGIFAKQKLFELARKEKLDLSKYEIDSGRDVIAKFLEKNKGKELVRMFELYQKMSRRSRIKLLRYANTLVK